MHSRSSQLRVPYAGTREWPFRPSRFHFPSAGFRVCATTSGVCSTGTEHRASRLLNKRSSNRVPSLVHVFLCKLKVRKVFLNFLSSQVIIFFCLVPFPPSSLSFFSSAPLPPCLFPFPCPHYQTSRFPCPVTCVTKKTLQVLQLPLGKGSVYLFPFWNIVPNNSAQLGLQSGSTSHRWSRPDSQLAHELDKYGMGEEARTERSGYCLILSSLCHLLSQEHFLKLPAKWPDLFDPFSFPVIFIIIRFLCIFVGMEVCCGGWVFWYTCVEAKGQPWGSSKRVTHLDFGDSLSLWPGAYLAGQGAQGTCCHCLCSVTSSWLFPWILGANSGPRACPVARHCLRHLPRLFSIFFMLQV